MMTRTSHGLEASLPPLAGGRGKERQGREGEGPDGGRGGGGSGVKSEMWLFPGNHPRIILESSSNHPRNHPRIILESSSQSSSNHPRNHPRIILASSNHPRNHPQIILHEKIIVESSSGPGAPVPFGFSMGPAKGPGRSLTVYCSGSPVAVAVVAL